jgi:hypothetical protein
MCCYSLCHGNAVKGFWLLWNNIYDYVCLQLLDFSVILDDSTSHSKIKFNFIHLYSFRSFKCVGS